MKRFYCFVIIILLTPTVVAQTKKRKVSTCGATSIGNCPKEGCGGDPEMNKRKNLTTRPSASEVEKYTWLDFTKLTFPEKWKRGTRRNLLRDWGEGTPVEYEAYLVHVKNYTSGIEATNCNLKEDKNNDWHIVLQKSKNITDEHQSITAEVTPRIRPNGWTIKKVRKLAKDKAYVKLVGYLFLDTQHMNSKEPKRITHWEIHPVTSFKVCKGSVASCKAGDNWQDLSDFPEP